MIYESLTCIAEEMNVFFRSRLTIAEDKVIVSALTNQDGSVAVQGENKVVITLINIIRDMDIKKDNSGKAAVSGNGARPVCIQVYFLVSSFFTAGNYAEALRFLSFVISFFQQKNVFDHANTPRLDEGIEKLILEMESFDPDKLNNIWSTLGAKYMPSVIYRIRMIILNAGMIREYRPVVQGMVSDM